MKSIIIFIIAFANLTISQNYQQDNGIIAGYYTQAINYEETCYLKPKAPGKLNKIFVYLSGSQNNTDTLRIVGDPSDGEYPGSWWVSGLSKINLYGEFIYTFSETGWYEFDVSSLNIELGGINSIGVQHIIKSGGPFIAIDDNGLNSNSSFINDVFTPNSNFYNIRGTLFGFAQGDFLVRAEIDWDYPNGNDSKRPDAKLVDVTQDVGLLKDDQLFGANEAAIIDYNNDGFDDISVGGELYINNANSEFILTDVGLSGSRLSWADLDNDGFLDAYSATGSDSDKIFWGSNDGMIESTPEIFKNDFPTMSVIYFDMDLDGDLDIYIAHNRRTVNGNEVYYKDQLYRNDGNREFSNVTDNSAIDIAESSPMDCYGANIVDYNNDSYPDIFVASYRLAPDQLYINDGTGSFIEAGKELGIEGEDTFNPDLFGHGMGADWGDYNNDGFVDLAIGNLSHPDERGAVSNSSLIYKNNGNDSFQEVGKELGIRFLEMNSACTWVDINNDGYLDLWHNQYSYQKLNTSGVKNNFSRLYINSGPKNNFKFSDKTWDYGSIIHGAWTAQKIDFDNDGDQDLLVCSAQENIKLFRNDLEQGAFVKVRLHGSIKDGVNLQAYGSIVTVKTDFGTYQKQLMGTRNQGRNSQSSDEIIFGLGESTVIEEVAVTFSDGQTKSILNPAINSSILINLSQNSNISKPNLLYPYNGSIINTNKITLNWGNIIEAENYEIVIARNENMENPIIENTIDYATNSYYNVELDNGVYYWQVRAINSNNQSELSDIYSFNINGINSIKIPSNISDINVYPIPASNRSISIDFKAKYSSFGTVDIFDLDGRLINDLFNGKLNEGINNFNLNTSLLMSGTYIIKISDDRGTLTKRFVIDK
ncbi:FG-GAP-like repeat-containing protein [Candidatus Kapabacteria bacterium]|nr:FG-GAP-like repeat-containing protein [Candidatus Kapabacteria bacterium]